MKKFFNSLTDNKTLFHFLSLVFIFFATLTLYLRLGRDPLFNWDEGIYAELGVEALKLHHWLTPTWNYQLWLEKPPGIAWTTALGIKLWGINHFGARFFMPLFAGLTLFFVYSIGKRLKDSYLGLLATLLMANMNLFLSRARAVNTDGALLVGIVATVYLAMIDAAPWLVALAIAFSVFFKGLAGFLSLIIALPLLITKPKKYMLRATCYMLLFILPWHLYQLIVNGDQFLTPYFKEQVLRRVTVPIEFHLESKWYYFRYLYQNLGITWIFLLVLGLLFLVPKLRSPVAGRWSLVTLIWWLFFPLVLFTLAKTRLFWYILPVYPAVALIIAYLLHSLTDYHSLSKQTLLIFLPLYTLFSFQQLFHHIDFNRYQTQWPDRVILAQQASQLTSSGLAVFVPASERLAYAILPSNQRISSSFRYGGAPNLVFYAQQPITYFYDLDQLKQSLSSYSFLILHRDDYHQLSPFSSRIIKEQGDYLLIQLNHGK